MRDEASPNIIFPEEGPFDKRRGYVRIPAFVRSLDKYGYAVTRQARFSPELSRAVRMGISPPYKEKAAAGLMILDRSGKPMYEGIHRERIYPSFEDIPEDVINILLFIENRELLKPKDEHQNPVVEWDRMALAGIKYIGHRIGIPISLEGGSTLATQLEKYQHSGGGRTQGAMEKIRQITSASLKAYRTGRNTTASRKEVITDYINTVPLASAAEYGEVNGLGEGLWAWLGDDFRDISSVLQSKDNLPSHMKSRAEAFKKIMTLLLAVKAPTYYLVRNQPALMQRVDYYTDLMMRENEISKEFHDLLKSIPLKFRTGGIDMPTPSFVERKAPNAIRNHVLDVLDLPGFYDLDRLDMSVQTTLDADIQKKIMFMLQQLTDTEYVKSVGLTQERMLKHGDPGNVIYSFLLYEKTPLGNVLRVEADNLNKPLDINEGVKLELGSTAKLRTLAHYLQIVSKTYEELSGKNIQDLKNNPELSKDPLTRWLAGELAEKPGVTLREALESAMERKFSASPAEVFFTGSGQHTFKNFNKADNSRTMSLYDGLRNSVNLVFIRLMREIVYYHLARLDVNTKAVLENMNHPERKELLRQIADKESAAFLLKFFNEYRSLTPDRDIEKLLGKRSASARHLTLLFYALHPSASPDKLSAWLRQRVPNLTEKEILRLAQSYGKPNLTLSDYGYLLSRHPLELWTIGYLQTHPDAEWKQALLDSADTREKSSAWLFQTRNKHAQDIRLKILFEERAFREIHKAWKKLGYPFDHLVPSYATAIGSSADRPASLAELMGIIMNDGVHMPMLKVTKLNFAKDTPYETELSLNKVRGERVMPAEVAYILRKALTQVVENGTARSVYGALTTPAGPPVVIGGKTGSGDNRFEAFGRGGRIINSRVINRTAAFVFFIGSNHFGVLTAFMPGEKAADYSFTSSLPVHILRLLAPTLKPMVAPDAGV